MYAHCFDVESSDLRWFHANLISSLRCSTSSRPRCSISSVASLSSSIRSALCVGVGDARRDEKTRRATRRRERRAATARGARARVYVTTPLSVHVATPHSTWYVPRSTRSCRQTTTIVLFSLVEMRFDDDASERTQQCFVRAQDVSRSDEITMICKFLVMGGVERNISGCVVKVTVMVTARFSFYLGVARQRGDVERGAHEVRDDVAVDDVGVALRRGGSGAREPVVILFVDVQAMASGYDTGRSNLSLSMGPRAHDSIPRAHSSPPWRDRRTSRRASA